MYCYSFKILLCFWLVKTARIIYHNQLLLTKFEPMQGSKLKKLLSRLLATNWRILVARCKFQVASLCNLNNYNVRVPLVESVWYRPVWHGTHSYNKYKFKIRKQRNTYFYKTILPKLKKEIKLSSCYLCSLWEPNAFACTTLYEGINMGNNHSLPDFLFSSETTCPLKITVLNQWRQNGAKVQPAADHWTIDRENLGTRLRYFGEWKNKERNGKTPSRTRNILNE